MSKNLESLLNRLDASVGKNQRKNKVDYKELNEARKKAKLTLKEGKNQVAFVTPSNAVDPFVFWGYHNGLQEVAWYSVPCNAYNKQESCPICSIVDELKTSDKEGNKHLWYPIRQQIEVYAPVINLESDATIAEGLKWLRMSKTVVSQLSEWIRNLEKSEQPFYSDDEPQKVIINYDKAEQPANQYKLVAKNMKAFSGQQLVDWRGELKDVSTLIQAKSQDEIKKIVDSYFERITTEVLGTEDTQGSVQAPEDTAKDDSSKLDFLKKK